MRKGDMAKGKGTWLIVSKTICHIPFFFSHVPFLFLPFSWGPKRQAVPRAPGRAGHRLGNRPGPGRAGICTAYGVLSGVGLNVRY